MHSPHLPDDTGLEGPHRDPATATAVLAVVAPVVSVVGLLAVAVLLMPSLHGRHGDASPAREFQFAVCIGAAVTAATIMLAWTLRPVPGRPDIGLGRSGLRATLIELALPTAIGVGLLLLIAALRPHGFDGIRPVGTRWVRTTLIYFGWAMVQQWVFLGFVFRCLRARGLARRATILITAVAFSSFHLPNPGLVALTLVSGLVWYRVYARRGNLLGVALSHALIGLVAQEIVHMDTLTGIHYLERITLG